MEVLLDLMRCCRPIFVFIFSVFSTSVIYPQNVEWANKLLFKSVEYTTDWNYPELCLGPPSIYPDANYEAELFDIYADGYILHPDKNKHEYIEVGFIKPMPANNVVISGILNKGVIKKVFVILKDKKAKQIFNYQEEQTKEAKVLMHRINYNLETCYGIRLIVDHTKINKWNIIKGIGIYKGSDSLAIKPNLYDMAQFPYPKDSIGHNINTSECFEFNPRLSSDGSKMYFVKECPGSDNQDIWYAESDAAGKWKPAQDIGHPLNNPGHNFIASVSLDGKTLFIGNTYKPTGDQQGAGLSCSKWQEDKTWSTPQNFEIPGIENKHVNTNYFISNDQTAILIAMEDENSIGDLDLYVSLYNKYKKSWDAPFNLGNVINTSFTEDYPYLSFDGTTLYFSSKGHIGYGGHDIYMSRRLDNSWTKWTQPINLGAKINSKTDDDGFMISNAGDYAFFNTVAFDSVHNMDIFKIKLPKVLQQHPQVLVKGKILSQRNGQPVRAVIRYKEKGKNHYESAIVTNDADGNFAFILPHGKEYDIVVEASNHFKITDMVSLLDTNNKSKVLRNYKIEAFLDSGQVSVLSNILFDFGTANLKDTSYHELNKLIIKLAQQNKSVIEVSGHTDDVGSDDYNLKLSEERAKTVVNYLVSKGVRPWRLKPRGYGEMVPIASNDTDDGRMLNRRVEMLILDEDFTKKYQKNTARDQRTKQRFNFYSNVSSAQRD